nr:diguanylate cyclase [uncultured Roseococcus sp.]
MREERLRAPQGTLAGAAIVFTVVLAACLFGIGTRPLGFLAAFWPANALLLGIFVRFPHLQSPAGWIAAAAGYLAADFMTGGEPLPTLWLTAANMAEVATGSVLFRMVSEEDRRLRRPSSVLYLFGILVVASMAAGVVGAGAAPLFFDSDFLSGMAFWVTTELTNSIIVLPVVLTAPSLWPMLQQMRLPEDRVTLLRCAAPALTLLASVVVGALVGGPGASTFHAPALLWCALSYPIFPSVVLTMMVSIWHLIAISLGFFASQVTHHDGYMISGRLGIMLLALAPLTVASINLARNELLARLEQLATYDMMTGALSRAAFMQRGSALISQPMRSGPYAVLMLDIDRFKQINDTYGHAAGDRVLSAFSACVRSSLREADLFGRVGGEEFSVILPNTPREDALRVAERVRANVEGLPIPIEAGAPLHITVSIGITHQPRPGPGPTLLDALISAADRALYIAKGEGRNQIVHADA